MIQINRRLVRTFLFSMVVLLILADVLGPLVGITSLFALDKQGSISVWFESFLYLVSALALGLAALALGNEGDRSGWRWGLFSLFMVYLSANTAAEVNKKLVGKFTSWMWWIDASLVDLALFIFLALALLVILWPVLAGMPSRVRRLLLLSGAVFGLGAIVVDDLADLFIRGGNGWLYILEELLEFSGVILFIDAVLAYLQTRTVSLNIGFGARRGQDLGDP